MVASDGIDASISCLRYSICHETTIRLSVCACVHVRWRSGSYFASVLVRLAELLHERVAHGLVVDLRVEVLQVLHTGLHTVDALTLRRIEGTLESLQTKKREGVKSYLELGLVGIENLAQRREVDVDQHRPVVQRSLKVETKA